MREEREPTAQVTEEARVRGLVLSIVEQHEQTIAARAYGRHDRRKERNGGGEKEPHCRDIASFRSETIQCGSRTRVESWRRGGEKREAARFNGGVKLSGWSGSFLGIRSLEFQTPALPVFSGCSCFVVGLAKRLRGAVWGDLATTSVLLVAQAKRGVPPYRPSRSRILHFSGSPRTTALYHRELQFHHSEHPLPRLWSAPPSRSTPSRPLRYAQSLSSAH